jgi:hypothetical protein
MGFSCFENGVVLLQMDSFPNYDGSKDQHAENSVDFTEIDLQDRAVTARQ